MGIKKIIASAALLVISTGAWAAQPPLDEATPKVFGSGNKACRATCIATCGSGINSRTQVGEQPVVGLGEDATKAYNAAAMGCRAMSLGACNVAGNELVIEVRSGYIVNGSIRSNGLVVLGTTPANVENCSVK